MGYKIAVVGATGLVGQECLRLMEERKFPVDALTLFALDRPVTRKINFEHKEFDVRGEIAPDSFRNIDFAIFSSGTDVSRHYAPHALQAGALVIDNSPAFRMLAHVPLVVPEVNVEDMKSHRGTIASPNSTTIQMTVALNPLHKINPIKRVITSTYHAVSSLGTYAMDELTEQTRQILNGQSAIPHSFPHQIAFNLLPEVDVFLDSGYTKEESSLIDEMRKVFHYEDMPIVATSVRAPVYNGNSAVVYVELSRPMSVDDVEYALAEAPGIKILDEPNVSLYPQPWSATGTDEVHIGRIRQDLSHPNGVVLWVVIDNIRRGALNVVRIMEELIRREWLHTNKEAK
jgi:aspartate-semialdehyde dehydrogenase